MFIIQNMNVPELLNNKFLEWQFKSGERKTLEDFAKFIGVKRSLLSMWLNGERNPGPDYRKKLIELFGESALEAFGEDPDLFIITKNWEHLNLETKKRLRTEAENEAKNRLQQSPKSRRVAKTD